MTTNKDGMSVWQALEALDPVWMFDHIKSHPVNDHHLYFMLTEGYWYATGFKEPISPQSRAARIPSHLWGALLIYPDDNKASRGGLTYVGLEFYEITSEAIRNPILLRPADAGREGGLQPKYNIGLQEAVNKIIEILKKDGKTGTPGEFKNWLIQANAKTTLGEFEPVSFEIPNCDDLYLDGDKLVWKDRDGRENDMSLRSLETYIYRDRKH